MNALLPILLFSVNFMIPQTTDVGLAQIVHVSPNTPAAAAGLKAGDRIATFQGKVVSDRGEVQRLAANVQAGQIVRLTLKGPSGAQLVSFKAGKGL